MCVSVIRVCLVIACSSLCATMTEQLVHITEDRVRQLLDWTSTVQAVEESLVAVADDRVIQNPRSFTRIPNTGNVLLSMPGYLENGNKSVLACKLVTGFTENDKRTPPLPSILANIFLFDKETGQLKSIIEGNEITAWRTAAASVVATKYLHSQLPGRNNNILAILGAGTQGRIHAIALQHFFKFTQVRIWNRTPVRAESLAKNLSAAGVPATAVRSARDCVKGADVIVTATYASAPIVHLAWVKPNVHINAVGAGTNHHNELDEEIYRKSVIYVDHMESALVELRGLREMGVDLKAEIGAVITKREATPDSGNITVFHSLGMAVEDGAVGQLIYERYLKENI